MDNAPSPGVTLVILGASGDLTERLLLPGLGTLLQTRPELDLTLVSASNETWSQERWRELVNSTLTAGGCSTARVRQAVDATRYVQLDVTVAGQLQALLAELSGQIVLYFALPPAVTMEACREMATIDLPPDLRLAVEKPFGTDLASAQQFNELLFPLVREDQVFRVDHYLGKATVLNLLGLRFANRVVEPVWDATNIEQVEITVDETLALEGRAGYYDRAGTLKDMIQSHLLLVLAMLAMEEPARIDALELRDLMAHVLRSTHLWGDDPVASSRRARYTTGTVDGEQIPSYVDEPGVDPARETETLAEVTVEVRNSRWSARTARSSTASSGATRSWRCAATSPRNAGGSSPRSSRRGPMAEYRWTSTAQGPAVRPAGTEVRFSRRRGRAAGSTRRCRPVRAGGWEHVR